MGYAYLGWIDYHACSSSKFWLHISFMCGILKNADPVCIPHQLNKKL